MYREEYGDYAHWCWGVSKTVETTEQKLVFSNCLRFLSKGSKNGVPL